MGTECLRPHLHAASDRLTFCAVPIAIGVLPSIAIGVLPSGNRTVLGVSVSLSEAEVHWRDFLQALKKRGMHGMQLIVSDAHEGLKAARKAIMPSVPWQRCQFHRMQNALQYIPKIEMRSRVAQDLRNIFNAKDLTNATEELKRFGELYKDTTLQRHST